MPKYLCLQRTLPTSPSDAPAERPSPAQMQALYAEFEAWRARFSEHLVDLGGRLGAGRLVAPRTPDGPWIEVKELAGGYMIVSAATLEEAADIARACPGLVGAGSGVEVITIHTPG